MTAVDTLSEIRGLMAAEPDTVAPTPEVTEGAPLPDEGQTLSAPPAIAEIREIMDRPADPLGEIRKLTDEADSLYQYWDQHTFGGALSPIYAAHYGKTVVDDYAERRPTLMLPTLYRVLAPSGTEILSQGQKKERAVMLAKAIRHIGPKELIRASTLPAWARPKELDEVSLGELLARGVGMGFVDFTRGIARLGKAVNIPGAEKLHEDLGYMHKMARFQILPPEGGWKEAPLSWLLMNTSHMAGLMLPGAALAAVGVPPSITAAPFLGMGVTEIEDRMAEVGIDPDAPSSVALKWSGGLIYAALEYMQIKALIPKTILGKGGARVVVKAAIGRAATSKIMSIAKKTGKVTMKVIWRSSREAAEEFAQRYDVEIFGALPAGKADWDRTFQEGMDGAVAAFFATLVLGVPSTVADVMTETAKRPPTTEATTEQLAALLGPEAEGVVAPPEAPEEAVAAPEVAKPPEAVVEPEPAPPAAEEVAPEAAPAVAAAEEVVPPVVEEAEPAPAVEEPAVEAEAPPAPQVRTAPVDSLSIDAKRFQFKRGLGEKGVSGLLRDVDVWDPNRAGVIAVWKDPADGKTYVVNGHHRYALARRLAVKEVNIIEIDAPTADKARAVGAMINIAEGRGTALDAARLFHDTGITEAEAKAEGLSLKEATVRRGLAISSLNEHLFDLAMREELAEATAVLIGESVSKSVDQEGLFAMLEKRRRQGRRLTRDVIKELVRQVTETGTVTRIEGTLFGEVEIEESYAIEKAELSVWIKTQLRADQKTFGFVAKEKRAERLTIAGNIIDVAKSKEIAQAAELAEFYYDKLSTVKGPVGNALEAAAKEIAGGANKKTTQDALYETVRKAISEVDEAATAEAPVGGEVGTAEPAGLFGQVEKGKPKGKRIISEKSAEEAKRTIDDYAKGETLFVGIPADLMKAYFVRGAYHFENGVRKFAAWSAAMVKELGAKVQPHLDNIWTTISVARPAKELLTSIKLESVNASRASRGLDPVEGSAAETQEQWTEEAKLRRAEDPEWTEKLIAEMIEDPRPLDDVETAGMTLHLREVENARNKAAQEIFAAEKAGDDLAKEEARRDFDNYNDDRLRIEEAGKAAGEKAGRSLVARKIALEEDFSLGGLLSRTQAANDGKPLTERQKETIKRQADRIAQLEGELAEAEEDESEEAGDKAVDEVIKVGKKRVAKRGVMSQTEEDRYQAALDRRRAARAVSGEAGFLEPAALADWVEIGGYWAKRLYREGARVIKDMKVAWLARMKKDAPELSEAEHEEVWESLQGEGTLAAPRLSKAEAGSIERTEGIRKATSAGRPMTDLHRAVQQLAYSLVEEGVNTRDELVDAVHEILVQMDPTMTRRDTRDAISGYGAFRPLSKDQIQVKLRDLKGQMQQISKLEDMQAGRAPSKTGVERRTPSNEERQLIKQVNEAKRRGGFIVTDPARQLRTALETTKTRLRHQIADLELQITSGERTVQKRTVGPTDAEVESMKERRDALKEQFNDIFGDREATDEQRLESAKKAVARSIAEYERRIEEGDVFPGPRKPKLQVTQELQALKDRAAALRNELKTLQDMADAADPSRLDAIRNQAYATRTANRIAELQDKLAREDFAPPAARRATPLTKKNQERQHELAMIKAKIAREMYRLRRKQRTVGRKILGAIGEVHNIVRAIKTSIDVSAVGRQDFFNVFAHPVIVAKRFARTFRAIRSEQQRFALDQELRNRPGFALAEKAGVVLTERGGPLVNREEPYASALAEKIPIVAASERIFSAYLNEARAESFDELVETLGQHGGHVTQEEADILGEFANAITGRGLAGAPADSLVAMNQAFFSVQLVASRFKILIGYPLWGGKWKGTARARKAIAWEYARFLRGILIVYGLYALARLAWPDELEEIEHDPRSSDFGKIKVGNTRIDPLGGLSQITVFLTRLVFGEMKTSGGKIVPLRGEDATWYDIKDTVGSFLQNKASPLTSTSLSLLSQKDWKGDPITATDALLEAPTPMALQDIYEAMQDQGVSKGAALGILVMLGVGMQTYEAKRAGRTRRERPAQPTRRKRLEKVP